MEVDWVGDTLKVYDARQLSAIYLHIYLLLFFHAVCMDMQKHSQI
ncbi:MAG: hypothetical protein ACLUJN_15100 [Blautia sp.]